MKRVILILIAAVSLFAQGNDEWLLISSSSVSTTYMSTKNLESFKGDDVYVWVMEKHNPPLR